MNRHLVIGTAGLALGMALVATLVVNAHASPSSPSLEWLKSNQGFVVSPLQATEPIGMATAEAAVFSRNAFPLLPKSTPMAAELLMWELPGNQTGLGRMQPVWLITWAQTYTSANPVIAPAGSPAPATPSITYHHMNVIVSATTGKALIAFPSP